MILKSVDDIAVKLNTEGEELNPLCKKDISALNGDMTGITPTPYEENPDESESDENSDDLTGASGIFIVDNESKKQPPSDPDSEGDETEQRVEKLEEPGIHVQFGRDRLDASPVFWKPNDTNQVFHTNTGIIGTMGTGKTQFTKSLIAQLHKEQAKNVDGLPIGILIFDYKGDYWKRSHRTLSYKDSCCTA